MNKLFFLLIATLLACSTTSKNNSDDGTKKETSSTERTFTVEVDSIARTKTPAASFNFKNIDHEKDLRATVDLEPLSLGLKKEGYKEVTAHQKGELEVEVTFKKEKPITGIAILGNITPYTHILTVKAYKGKTALWETQVTAKTEHEDVRVVLPIMVAAAEGYFGKTSQGKKEVRIQKSDERVEALTPKTGK